MRRLILIATLLFAGLAAAKAPLERSFHARVQVSAEGAVEGVEVQEGLPAPVAALVQDAAARLAFTPATVDGEPAASKTTVWVRMRFEPGEGDALKSTVLSTSQANPFNRVPQYPFESLRDIPVGRVWLDLAVTPEGAVDMAASRVESVELLDEDGKPIQRRGASKAVAQAAMKAAEDWTIYPEEVAGVSRATKVLVPVSFCRVKRGQVCPVLPPRAQEGERVTAEAGVALAKLAPAAAPPEA